MTRRAFLGSSAAAGAATVAAKPAAGRAVAPRTREYWVGSVPTKWNIVPNGRDAIEKQTFSPDATTVTGITYRLFTRGHNRMLPRPKDLGMIGPLIRARVGDRILVHFLNLDLERPHSMHFHGVHYEPGSDGAYIPGFSGKGGNVAPGENFTYRLRAGRDSAGVWPYHDHSTTMHESIMGGLYGAMSILAPNQRVPDREHVVFLSTHLSFMTINGRAFVGNTPLLRARVGDLVQWDVLTLGDDFHTFHIHGHRWRAPDGTFVDTKTVGPAESFAIRFREDAPGAWLYHCHVESHMSAGMIGLYQVKR